MAGQEAMLSVLYGFAVLALLTGFKADGSVAPQPAKFFLRKDREVKQQQLHGSALNTALAFDLYRDLATRTTAEPNILFSPLGLASALALLSQVSGSESRSQALRALGLEANSTEQSVEATISALTDLQRKLTTQERSGGDGSEATAGAAPAAGNRTGGEDEAVGGTGTEDGARAGGQLRLWSRLNVDGKTSTDYDRFFSSPQHPGSSAFNISFETLKRDLQTSDKLILHNYVSFKGSRLSLICGFICAWLCSPHNLRCSALTFEQLDRNITSFCFR